MPFCPNPECPHIQKIGKPAEFLEEITHCSDCGSPLTEKIVEAKTTPNKQKSKIQQNDFQKRIFYTLGFILLWRVLTHIAVPGINFEALEKYMADNTRLFGIFPFRMSVFALGIMPYISAYVLVECLALFIPPLKSWRQSGYYGRAKLLRTALWITLALAFIQGFIIAEGIEDIADGSLVINPGTGFRLITALTLTTGTFITIFIADHISKKGIGHGISILLFTGYIGGSFHKFLQHSNVLSMFQTTERKNGFLEHFLLFLLIAVISVYLIVLIEKTYRKIKVMFDDGTEAYIPLKLTTAGTVPIGWASSLIMAPLTIAAFSSNMMLHEIATKLFPGEIIYNILLLLTIMFFYYLFASFFYNPKKIINFLKMQKATIVVSPEENEEKYIDKSLEVMTMVGALYLCFIVVLSEMSLRSLGIFLGGAGLITMVAILLDITEELRFRWKSTNLIKVAELHDVPKAGLLKSLLEQKGIPCHLRGYYHRALLYFFGPFIEISALVPKDKANEADEIITHYLALK